VHTFVPGLPLTFLEYNLVTGDSLAGIGTLDEVTDILDIDQSSLEMFIGGKSVMDEVREDIRRLGSFADASAEYVQEARETRAEIEARLSQVQARFDILAASRVDESINTGAALSTNIEDVSELSEYERAQNVLESTDPLHFPTAFPEVFEGNKSGFDVILGNPPWEEERLDEDNYWRRYIPGLKGKSAGRKSELIKQIRADRPDLVEVFHSERQEKEKRREILKSGNFPGIGMGDPDTYKAFAWRFYYLTRPEGKIGIVLSRSAFSAAGSEKFRRKLLNEATIFDLTFLINNRNWVFPSVHPQFTIGLASIEKKSPNPSDMLPIKGPFPNSESFNQGHDSEPHLFNLNQALNWTNSASFPLLPPTPLSTEVFETQASHPPIGLDDPKSWRARPREGLHSSSDKKRSDGTQLMHFTDDPDPSYWPVYKGGTFRHWEPEYGDYYAWADPDLMMDYIQIKRENSYRYAGSRSAFYEMDEEWVKDPDTLSCLRPRVAYRKVSRRTDTRTIITSLVPEKSFLTDGSPYFLWPRGDQRDMSYLLGVISSIPFDWYARRFVETNVNLHLINSFPVPRPGRNNPVRHRVVQLSGRLAAVDDRYADWADAVSVEYGPLDDDSKQQKIYELDAVVAHLYGLTSEHVEVIFETFHRGWDYEERLAAVLDYYDSWAERLGPDRTQQTETVETDD
jgi:hypothetical protein